MIVRRNIARWALLLKREALGRSYGVEPRFRAAKAAMLASCAREEDEDDDSSSGNIVIDDDDNNNNNNKNNNNNNNNKNSNSSNKKTNDDDTSSGNEKNVKVPRKNGEFDECRFAEDSKVEDKGNGCYGIRDEHEDSDDHVYYYYYYYYYYVYYYYYRGSYEGQRDSKDYRKDCVEEEVTAAGTDLPRRRSRVALVLPYNHRRRGLATLSLTASGRRTHADDERQVRRENERSISVIPVFQGEREEEEEEENKAAGRGASEIEEAEINGEGENEPIVSRGKLLRDRVVEGREKSSRENVDAKKGRKKNWKVEEAEEEEEEEQEEGEESEEREEERGEEKGIEKNRLCGATSSSA